MVGWSASTWGLIRNTQDSSAAATVTIAASMRTSRSAGPARRLARISSPAVHSG